MSEEVTPVVEAPVIAPIPDEVAETAEWDAATKEMFPGLDIDNQEPELSESTKPKKDVKEEEADKPAPEAKEPDAKPESGDDAKDKGEGEPAEDAEPDTSARDTRLAAREAALEIESVKADVREKMFAELPTELKDADGDPIKSVEDVMKLINPRTGEAFTADEASTWLVASQAQFKENLANAEAQIAQIAEVNISLKDQSDVIKDTYGELLKEMPDLQKELWAEYEKTLVHDPKTGIIIKAPVSLQNFYRMALEPYANLARSLEQKETDRAAEEAATAAAEAEAKTKTRVDRSDIYAVGKTDTSSEEDKEWGAAIDDYYGKQGAR